MGKWKLGVLIASFILLANPVSVFSEVHLLPVIEVREAPIQRCRPSRKYTHANQYRHYAPERLPVVCENGSGYRVFYLYDGEEYAVELENHPGDRIRVEVSGDSHVVYER